MVLRRFRKEAVLAGFAAEAQVAVVGGRQDLTFHHSLRAILHLGHEALLRFGGWSRDAAGGAES